MNYLPHSKTMLNLTGLDVDCPDHDNNTALHIAAANDHEVLVSFLLEHQADHETTNNLGWTPLMQAARHGHMNVVVLLVRAKAAVDKQNRLGEWKQVYCYSCTLKGIGKVLRNN